MRKESIHSEKKKTFPIMQIVLAVLAVILVAIIAVAALGNDESKGDESPANAVSDNTEKWQEGVIKYNDKYYQYNNQIKTYLIMGIDKEDNDDIIVEEAQGGQSDAMFLLVVDAANEKMSVISINRNSMTDIAMYDENGVKTGTVTAQICTQHGFGDGKHLSCSRATDAVSRLFYNIPIQGYLSLRMGAIPIMNDAIGGVELAVLQDLEYPESGVSLKEGETKLLSGTEAYYYLRGRSLTEFDSATSRLRRQEQYITSFVEQMKAYTGGSKRKLMGIYDAIENYIVTNLDFANLASQIGDYEFEAENMYTVPGETIMGTKFEEYHVDDTELYNMIIDIFYQEVIK